MLSKPLRVFTAIAAVGLLVMAGCGSGGGGGGGGGGDDGATGPPTVTGYTYYVPDQNAEITRSTSTNEWVSENLSTGASNWGTYTVSSYGLVKLVRTGYTDVSDQVPAVMYAAEVANGFLFIIVPESAGVGGSYTSMLPAFNTGGDCASISTQGNYNLIKSGQSEWNQVTGRAFGTGAFTTPGTGLDLAAGTYVMGETFVTEPLAMNSTTTMNCAAGQGGSGDLSFLFTASGGGMLTQTVGLDNLDFVLSPEPASPVDGSALMASGVRYAGIYQQMVDQGLGAGLEWAVYLAKGDGTGSGIAVDSYLNPDTDQVTGEPGTIVLGTLPVGKNAIFDQATFTFNSVTTPAAASVYSVGGKAVLTVIGRFDQDFDTVNEPEDWFFMILVEFESNLP